MKVVGTNRLGYPEIRNITQLAFRNYKVKKCLDVYRIPSYALFKLRGKLRKTLLNSFYDGDLNRCDLYHFFNAVSYGKKPWITTFEAAIPRWGDGHIKDEKIVRGLELIASSSCKRVIAISECAANTQKDLIINLAPSLYDAIVTKMEVIAPPQRLVCGTSEKSYSEKIVFTIVGSEFVIKGGMEVLAVFDKILKHTPKVHLNIVSKFSDASKEEIEWIRNTIKRHEKNITHYTSLPNNEVLELFRKSHVGLLPSHSETYGYSVLEAQACGCPVITTNFGAFNETNNSRCGWLIEIPAFLDEMGRMPKWGYQILTKEIIEFNLYEIILDILNNPGQIEKKRSFAIDRIKTFHDPIAAAIRLEKIYDQALL